MASHKRSFQCFDAIVDSCPHKPSFPVSHHFGAPQRSSHSSKYVEPQEDNACYLCAEHQQAKLMTFEASGIQSASWQQPQSQQSQHAYKRPTKPEGESVEGATHHHHHHHHHQNHYRHSKNIVLVKNTDPSIQKTIVLHRRSLQSLGVFLDDVSELMQCLIRKVYTLEGHKIDSIQSLLQCPSILVCVGREPFHPLLLDSFRRNSDNKLPKLNLKSRSSACSEEQGVKNEKFGLEAKKTIIHPRLYSSDKSARHTMPSQKSFPNVLHSVPPIHAAPFSQKRESVRDDDIEKRVLVNKDGSLSMEMKVRFRLLNDETLHWSTEIKKSSSTLNESFTGKNDACYLQHSNTESCSEAESLSEVDNNKLHQKHLEELHCKHCCPQCQEYDIWKNTILGEQGPVRHIRSSSSSQSSHKVICKKASVDSICTMSSEEYTQQIVEQQTVGEKHETVEYCTISRCCSRSELCSVFKKSSQIEEKTEKSEIHQQLIKDDNQPESPSISPIKNSQTKQVNVQITQVSVEEHRSVSVESDSSQILASLKEDQDEGEIDGHLGTSRASLSNNQGDDEKNRDAASSPQSITSCKSPASPKQQLSPRPPSKSFGSSVKSQSRHFKYEKSKDVAIAVEKEAAKGSTSETSPQPNHDEDDSAEPPQANKKQRSSSAMSDRSNNSGKSNKSKVTDVPEQENTDVKDNNEERTTSAMSTKSNISARSMQCGSIQSELSDVAHTETKEAEPHIEERVQTSLSNTSIRSSRSRLSEKVVENFVEDQIEDRVPSAMSAVSARSHLTRTSDLDTTELKDGSNYIEERSPSTMSTKTNSSVQSKTPCVLDITPAVLERTESQDRVPSNMSTKSNASATSKKSQKSQGTPADTEKMSELEERVPSAMSVKSNISMRSINSNISEVAPVVTFEMSKEHFERKVKSAMSNTSGGSTASNIAEQDSKTSEAGEETLSERAPSARSTKSNASVRTDNSKVSSVALTEANGELEKPRTVSSMSSKSVVSERPEKCIKCNEAMEQIEQRLPEGSPNAMSPKSLVSERSKKPKCSRATAGESALRDRTEERACSAMSTKSNTSTKTNKSKLSENFTDITEEQVTERALSSISNISTKSKKSKTSECVADISEEQAAERSMSALSSISNISTKSKMSKTSECVADISEEQAAERSTSALSSKSNISAKSKRSKLSISTNDEHVGLDSQTEQRAQSTLSIKSNTSERSRTSSASEIMNMKHESAENKTLSGITTKSDSEKSVRCKSSELEVDDPEDIEEQLGKIDQRPTSAMSAKSNASGKSNNAEADELLCPEKDSSTVPVKSGRNYENVERVASALSTKSNKSAKSDVSVKSTKSKANEEPSEELEQQKRAQSALSSKSSFSVQSNLISEASEFETTLSAEADNDKEDRNPRTTSSKSITSMQSKKSSVSESFSIKSEKSKKMEKMEQPSGVDSVKPCGMKIMDKCKVVEATDVSAKVNERSGERAASVLSSKSNTSAKSKKSVVSDAQRNNVNVDTCQTDERSQSALSVRSNASERSITLRTPEAPRQQVGDEDNGERALSGLSSKSNKSQVSDTVVSEPVEKDIDTEERAPSTKSYVSARSNTSEVSKKAHKKPETTDENGKEERVASALSACSLSVRSDGSARSKNSNCLETGPENPTFEDQGINDGASYASSPISNVSARSKKSESSEIALDEFPPGDLTTLSDKKQTLNTSTKCKKPTGSGRSVKAKEENVRRTPSALSVKSNTSATSMKSKSSDMQYEQVDDITEETEHTKTQPAMSPKSSTSTRSTKLKAEQTTEFEGERSASALSNGSIKSKRSQISQMECNIERKPTIVSMQTNMSEILKNNISEVDMLVERPKSVVSAKSNSSAKSKKSIRSTIQDESNISLRSAFSDNLNTPSPIKCVCGGLKKSTSATEIPANKANHEERSASALSIKSDLSAKTTSVGNTSERDITPASPSVSIGIVEDYDADNIEEECSMSVTTTPVPQMTLKNKDNANQEDTIMETQCDRSKSSLSVKTNVSGKTKKSESDRSNSPQLVSNTVCEMASSESVTKDTKENKSSLTKNVQSPSKASNTSQSKEKKPSSVTDRPESNISNASSCLEVKGHKSNSKSDLGNVQSKKLNNTRNSPTKEKEKDTSKPQSDFCATSENCLSPGPSKSPNKSKKPFILLGASNDSVLSQSVSAPEPLNENSKNLNTEGDVSERTCSGPPDGVDCGRLISDKASEKNSKCRNRKGSSSSQQKTDEITELVPSNLPNASPTEVVNEWLNKIPLDSALYDIGDEFPENCEDLETLNRTRELTQNETEGDVAVGVFEAQEEKKAQLLMDEIDKENKDDDVEKMSHKELADAGNDQSCPEKDDGPKSFHSSVQVMRVLLSPKLDRCNSLPEVSNVYGQKLSTSAKGLLDCLVNLQLIDFDPNDVNGKAEKYKDLMNILQSLWLSDPSGKMTVTENRKSKDQQSVDDELKAKSSSGVDVSSGSSGSGKSSVNDITKAQKCQTNTEGEGTETLTKVQEVDETEEEDILKLVDQKSDPATPDIASRVQWTPETEAEDTVEERLQDSNLPNSDETIRSNESPRDALETPSSSLKSTGNYSNAKQNEAETEHQEDTSSGTPPSVQRAQLTKKASQDPDPVWVLNLLNKLEKQFMTHYVNAMAEFKVRWNLDDNEQLNVMICELRDEVHKRIQSSIDRELKKIQGRAGRPRPPKEAMSRESTGQTEQRRRRLKVVVNQSIDPSAKSEDNYTGTGTDFSDQRSDDEYCPCDTCMKKKMATRPVIPADVLNAAPVMNDFDLRKILHLKREAPIKNKESITDAGEVEFNTEAEGLAENVLEVVTEEEEEEMNKAHIQHNVKKSFEAETEKPDINEETSERATEMARFEAEDSIESKTDEQEHAREVDTADYEKPGQGETAETENVEVAKAYTIEEEEIAEGVPSDEKTMEAAVAEVGEDEEKIDDELAEEKVKGSVEGETVGEEQPSEADSLKDGTEGEEEVTSNTAGDAIREDKETTEKEKTADKIKEGIEAGDAKIIEEEEIEDMGTNEAKTTEEEMADYDETQEDGEEPKANISEDEERYNENVEHGCRNEDETTEDGEGVEMIDYGEAVDIDAAYEVSSQKADENEETAGSKMADEERAEYEIEDGETANDQTVEDDQAADDGKAEHKETAYDGTAEDAEAADDETAEDEETADDGTAEDEETADDRTEEDGETANDGTAEDEETADDGTADDVEAADDETAEDVEADDDGIEEDGVTADDEIAEDGETADDEIAEDGETTDDGTADDVEAADDETAEDVEAADDGTVEEGETADDGKAEEDQTADDGTAEDEQMDGDKTADNVQVADDATAEDGETADDGTSEDEETADDGPGEDDQTADDGTAEDEQMDGEKTPDNVQATDDGTAEDGETADDGTAEDEETADNGKAKDEATADDGTGDDDQTADDGKTEDRQMDVDKTEDVEAADDETVEDRETADEGTAEDGETADDETAEDGETADDGTAEDGETANEGTTEDGETANDGTVEDDQTADEKTAEDVKAADDETVEEGETADDGTAEDGETAIEGTTEDGETANDGTVEDDQTADEKTAEDVKAADDETVEEGETADDGTAKDGETANEGSTEDGETADNGTVEDDQTADEKTAEDVKAADDKTVEEGETADDGIVEDGETANEGTAEDGETADDGTVEDGETANEGTAEDGETADDGTVEDGETADDGTVEDGETANEGTAEHDQTADDRTIENREAANHVTEEDEEMANAAKAEGGETVDDGTSEDDQMINDGTSEDRESADDGKAKDGEAADDTTSEDRETADDGTTEDGKTVDDGTEEDGETADDKTAEDGETVEDEGAVDDGQTAEDRTVSHGETADEILEKELMDGEVEAIVQRDMNESDSAEGDEVGKEEANSSIENTDGHDEVTELKADDEDDDEKIPLKNEGDVVVCSVDENSANEESKEEHAENTKEEESSVLMSDSQDRSHSDAPENDGEKRSHLNGHFVNTGESAEGGDEAEDETEPDVETDDGEQEMKIPFVQPSVGSGQEDEQTDATTMASFDAVVKIHTGSEDGAEADVEDSETEVHTSQCAENEEEGSVPKDRKQASIVHSPVERNEAESHVKLSDIAEHIDEDEDNEETISQDGAMKDHDSGEKVEDGLTRQISKSSVESQPGSLEEVLDEETGRQRSSHHLTVKCNCMYPITTSGDESKDTQEKSDTESVDLDRHAVTLKKDAK